jgi:hypothetical protein
VRRGMPVPDNAAPITLLALALYGEGPEGEANELA